MVGHDESATMASAEQLADRAHAVGAEWVLTVFTATVPPQRIQRCAKLFDDVGAGMAVEYTRWERFRRSATALRSYGPRAAVRVPA